MMGHEKNSLDYHDHLMESAPINWQDLYQRLPDEALILQFAASFQESAPQLVECLEQSVAQNTPQDIESNAHALKGAAANLGAVLLAKAAWQLENTAREQTGADFKELFVHVRTEFDRLMELLSHPDWIDVIKLS
jgi:HPt (histidine-containing phosphotransfer) domain-containing protein